jgi:transposase-like protein
VGSTAAAIWKKRVEGWRASGESCKAYAARIGVNSNTLAGWRWKLKPRSPGATAAKGAAAGEHGFVEVTEQLVTALAKEAGVIELEVGGAMVAGVDPGPRVSV